MDDKSGDWRSKMRLIATTLLSQCRFTAPRSDNLDLKVLFRSGTRCRELEFL